jgi:hypothetical protein
MVSRMKEYKPVDLTRVGTILTSDITMEKKIKRIRKVLQDTREREEVVELFVECGKKKYRFPTYALASDVANLLPERFGRVHADDLLKAIYLMHNWNPYTFESMQYFTALTHEMVRRYKEDVGSTAALSGALFALRNMHEHLGIRLLLRQVKEVMTLSSEPFDGIAIAHSMYGLQRMTSNTLEVRDLLKIIAVKIAESESRLSAKDVGMALFGMQGMTADKKGVRMVLRTLIQKIKECNGRFSAKDVSRSLYGMQRMSSDINDVYNMLSALAPKIEACEEVLTATQVSDAMLGLYSMTSRPKQVRTVLGILTPKLTACQDVFTSEDLSNALFGLQGISAGSPEARALINAMIRIVNNFRGKMNAREAANALYGLHSMNSYSPETRGLLQALLPKIPKSTEAFSSEDAVIALSCLHDKYSESEEVCSMLGILTQKVGECKQPLSAEGLGESLYHLQGISIDSQEERDFITMVAKKITECEDEFTVDTITKILYGMQRMDSAEPAVQLMLEAIIPKVQACDTDSSEAWMHQEQVGDALYGLQAMSTAHAPVRDLLASLVDVVASCEEQLSGRALSRALFGLQRTSCDVDSVRELLKIFGKISYINKIINSNEWLFSDTSMTAPQIGDALYGLQGMTDESKEVQAFMSFLLPTITNRTSEDRFKWHAAGRALFGMQRMSPLDSFVQATISTVCSSMDHSANPSVPRALSQILLGLKHHTYSDEVDELLSRAVRAVHEVIREEGMYGRADEMSLKNTSKSENQPDDARVQFMTQSFSELHATLQEVVDSDASLYRTASPAVQGKLNGLLKILSE